MRFGGACVRSGHISPRTEAASPLGVLATERPSTERVRQELLYRERLKDHLKHVLASYTVEDMQDSDGVRLSYLGKI